MPRLHILTQYLWPDDAPTGVYAEQVADAIGARGVDVRLVAGSGQYRAGARRPPRTPILRLDHRLGRRGKLISTALEYRAVHGAFARYVAREVTQGDVVIVTSAPPTSLFLHEHVRRRGAVGVYWLQDYYPELIRGVWDAPRMLLGRLRSTWDRALGRWDHVVKSAANLAYAGANASVIRNWNTIEPGEPRPAEARTALYSGNLGYGHDVDAFLAMCRRLHGEGYAVTVRGDGPGMRRLPSWIRAEAPLASPGELLASYWRAEVHLVAADPRLPAAIFPSKLWNARAVGRPIAASGFAGPMAAELELAREVDFRGHLPQWVEFVLGVMARGGRADA
ncbi:hypothetical protein [Anaeromyxobacter diazotrophicus]|uniref:Glycosyltransferase subfamily 4-like N-terminal domain-containing protein n=1 Tax=Anaeromyxobacter diazotrophicus TaxID=2590199 RepID=A0A7I9VHN2_9BACT|nr:hypothetical protein [Anaeromyxobacter diazotrophicus]GEJ55648.1 hypothetical protein AMYX_03890 [Anaeromyxobacter diazotrophicus]